MTNKFSGKDRNNKMAKEYDLVIDGKGWRLKKGESLDDLRARAAGKKKDAK